MPEWLIGAVLKTARAAKPSGVRIPLPPHLPPHSPPAGHLDVLGLVIQYSIRHHIGGPIVKWVTRARPKTDRPPWYPFHNLPRAQLIPPSELRHRPMPKVPTQIVKFFAIRGLLGWDDGVMEWWSAGKSYVSILHYSITPMPQCLFSHTWLSRTSRPS